MSAKDWSRSPVTGKQVGDHYLHTSDFHFRDTKGRVVLLRGINLSGSSKAPLGRPSHNADDFWQDVEAGGSSFVGQPLNLDDGSADIHLARLRAWGFNCIRYVFTWEALEHSGPRQYDYAYMDYLVAVLRKIKAYGFKVFMDPHQDLFSRFTGGSGAPYWVIIACGINPRNLTATHAAFLQHEWPAADAPDPINYPDMLWATNYTRLGAATVSALFWGGKQFAPLCVIDGKNIQDWLQEHFIAAVEELAKRLAAAGDLLDECVIGWDSINEPNKTYISLEDLGVLPKEWRLRVGPMPSPIQSFRLGVGRAQTVENYVFGSLGSKRSGSVTVDPRGKSIWLSKEQDDAQGGSRWGWKRSDSWPLGQCVWAAHGVWDEATGELLRPDYFHLYSSAAGEMPADFVDDYWLPHYRTYAARIRKVHPEAILFMQPPVFEPPPQSLTHEDLRDRTCISCHFYDGLTLITKHWNWFNADAVGLLRGKYASVVLAVRVGNAAIRQCIRKQLGYLRADATEIVGACPTLIGEIGIPFDMDKKRSYFGDAKGEGKGDYSAQTLALDASLNGCDGDNVLNYTMWTYCPDSTHMWGDGWNGEDLSIWSADDVDFFRSGSGSEAAVEVRRVGQLRKTESQTTFYTSSKGSGSVSNSPSMSKSASSTTLTPGTDPLSPEDVGVLSNGARAIGAFCRPYPMATCGTPVRIDFDIKSTLFVLEFETVPDQQQQELGGGGVTEIYLPYIHYAEEQPDAHHDEGQVKPQNTLAIEVKVSKGEWRVEGQVLFWSLGGQISTSGSGERPVKHKIEVRRKGGAFGQRSAEVSSKGVCRIL
ncbi:hypothetical protein ACQY0O_000123 [Thecaphora frezii]|nr:putative glycoside hydrolase [Thecaphora frezii]